MRLALPLDSHSLSGTSSDLCVSVQLSVHVFLYLCMTFGILTMFLLVPDILLSCVQVFSVRSCVCMCKIFVFVHETGGWKNKHTMPAQPQSPRLRSPMLTTSALHSFRVDLCHPRIWNIHFDFLAPQNHLYVHLCVYPLTRPCGRLWFEMRKAENYRKDFRTHKKTILQIWTSWNQGVFLSIVRCKPQPQESWGDLTWVWSWCWWWCASCRMTPNGLFWHSEWSYSGTERIMLRRIYPGTASGKPDTSLWNIYVGINIIIRGLFSLWLTAGSKHAHLTHHTPCALLHFPFIHLTLHPCFLFSYSPHLSSLFFPRNSSHFTFPAYFTMLANHHLHRLDLIRYQCLRQ